MNKVILEEWKPVKEYEGLYEVSNCGRLRSLVGWNGHEYIKRKKILNQSYTTTGYKKAELTKNKKKKSHKIHRLVANAFIPNPQKKPNVNHIDGNPTNNNLCNLEWCTQKENVDHAIKTGLKKVISIDYSELEHEYCEERLTIKEMAKKHKCSTATIRKNVEKYRLCRDKSKYGIVIETLKKQFDSGLTNAELAEIYNCPNNLIARRRYQYNNNKI